MLTVSDGVAGGTRDDRSGQALVERMMQAGFEVADHRVSADGIDAVADALGEMADGFSGLIVTTGGTGFGPRDLTPEGTRAVIEREAPGLVEAIRRVSDDGGRGFGMLSPRRRRHARHGADLQPARIHERRPRSARGDPPDGRARRRPLGGPPAALTGRLRLRGSLRSTHVQRAPPPSPAAGDELF